MLGEESCSPRMTLDATFQTGDGEDEEAETGQFHHVNSLAAGLQQRRRES